MRREVFYHQRERRVPVIDGAKMDIAVFDGLAIAEADMTVAL